MRSFIAFTGGTGALAWLIRKATDGDVNHVVILHGSDDWGGPLALGADDNGWGYDPAERITDRPVCRVYELPAGLDLRRGLRANRHLLGVRYDIGGLVGMGWVMLQRRVFKREVKNPFDAKNPMFCSEAVAKVLRDAGLDLGLAPGSTDPVREERVLRQVPGVRAVPLDEALAACTPAAAIAA